MEELKYIILLLAGELSVDCSSINTINSWPSPKLPSSAVSWVSLERIQSDSGLTMAKEVVLYCFLILNALVMNHLSGIAVRMDGIIPYLSATMIGISVWIATEITIIQSKTLG